MNERFKATAEILTINEYYGNEQQELRKSEHHNILIAQKNTRQWPTEHMAHR